MAFMLCVNYQINMLSESQSMYACIALIQNNRCALGQSFTGRRNYFANMLCSCGNIL